MNYKVILTKSAEKELYKLPKFEINKIASTIDALHSKPRPRGSLKLKGEYNLFRLRKGNLRIIYSIDDNLKIISILIIRNRKDAYK